MFLDPVVSSKIEIFGCKEAEWKKRLFEFIGEDNMPRNYGSFIFHAVFIFASLG